MIFLKIALTSEEMLQIYNDVKKKKNLALRKATLNLAIYRTNFSTLGWEEVFSKNTY